MKQRVSTGIGVCLLSGMASAATTAADFNNEAFVRAVVVVMTYDYLADGCNRRGGQPADAQRLINEWEMRNRVASIRSQIAELENQPTIFASLEKLRTGIREQMRPVYPERSCEAALASIKLKEAQLAAQAPPVLAQPPAPVSVSKGSKDGRAATLAPLIDSFGFDTRMSMGVGGFLTTVVYPVVLFRDGRALRNAEALAFPDGIDVHRQSHPKDWTRWRRAGDRVQVQDSKGEWKNMSFAVTYATLPADYRMDGSYQSLSGTGTVAVGGSDSVVAWRSYAFTKNGLVVRGGGSGAYAAVSGGSTAVSSIAPSQRGRYRIDGITLAIAYDDGSKENRIIVTDPKSTNGAIWLDGIGYTKRRE